MGICTRHFLLSVCILQLISTIIRQVFDFLGYMWIPILVNFFEIIFIIFGFFGTFQNQAKYVISYTVWNLILLSWNLYLVCLYLDIGILNHQESKVLKLDPESASWWENNGPGCKVTYNTTALPKPSTVTDCVFHYVHVEIFQAGLQSVLALLGCAIGTCLSSKYLNKGDTSRLFFISSSGLIPISGASHSDGRKSNKRTSLYSIEFSPQHDGGQADSDSMEYSNGTENLPQPVSPKPMTPRRVKRRSVMTRGSTSRHSTSSRRQSNARLSTRSSRRVVQNPVTQIIEQQQKVPGTGSTFDCPANITHAPVEPLPVYYNTVVNSDGLSAPPQLAEWKANGHTNPTYQQSSNQSLNEQDDLDDLYNNRPASVRSSYSNFHGTRALNYGGPQYYHSQATPQVPKKRCATANKPCIRSTAFLTSGPPAYSIQGHNSVDSETTI